jgi:hypothetical protein
MSKITAYKLIVRRSGKELVRDVNKAIEEGYQPRDGPLIADDGLGQLLVKKTEYNEEKIQKYLIVGYSDQDDVNAEVSKNLANGYELYGSIIMDNYAPPTIFIQAMVCRKDMNTSAESEKK